MSTNVTNTRFSYMGSAGNPIFLTKWDHVLACAGCGADNLHQRDVRVFVRNEDAEMGTAVSVEFPESLNEESMDAYHPVVAVGQTLDGNPSPRRQGITIEFCCEHCNDGTLLHIIQHKGSTYFQTEVVKDRFALI